MWQPSNRQWWGFVVVAVCIALAWPSNDDKSLALKLLNWSVDPTDRLPILPDELEIGQNDDPDAVYYHDMVTQQYDALYNKGGWTRMRLQLKVANDPFRPSTTRQVLAVFGAVAALIVWRFGARKS